MNKRFTGNLATLAAVLLLTCVTPPTIADVVEVEGSAVVQDGDLGRARIEAQQNALRQASMLKNANVQSQLATDAEGGVVDSLQVRSTTQVQSAEVLDEQVNGDLLNVRMRAQLGPENDVCDFPAAAYRKKVAAVYFPVANPGQVLVNDYYDYERGIPGELLKRLAVSGHFLTRDAGNTSLYPDPSQAPSIPGSTANGEPIVLQLGYDLGVQFVISGVVRDLSYQLSRGWFSSMTGNTARAETRNIGIDFYIHDVLTAELLASHHYTRSTQGENLIPEQPVRFGSAPFYGSDFGREFQRILDQETAEIVRLLRCRPFVMRVLEQRDGKLYLDAGLDSLIETGDVVTVYRHDTQGPVFGAAGKLDQFGWPKATLRVLKVFPGYSIAEPQTKADAVTFVNGEYLHAW